MLKKVSDTFAQLGWTWEPRRAEILNACSARCQHPVLVPSDLSVKEATDLATALGAIVRRESEDHYLVALSDAVDGWEHSWEEADPAGYELYKASS